MTRPQNDDPMVPLDTTSPKRLDGETAAIDEHLPLVPALRRFSKVTGYCLAMSVVIIGWGYDLVVVGSIVSVDSFLRDYGDLYEGDLIIPSNWLSLWLGLPPIGSITGSALGGWLQDRIGRRVTLMLGSVVSAIAVAIIFFSHLPSRQTDCRAMLTVGLTVQGLSVGMIKTTAITYVSENAPTSLRGPAMALFPSVTLLGQLIGSIVVYVVSGVEGQTGYLGAFGSQWALSVAPFVLACVMPESPAYLVRRGYEERALKSATALYAPKVDPQGALESIRAVIEEERALAAQASYRACFQGTNLRRTMIIVLAYVMPTLFGLDLLSSASYFLKLLGLSSSTALLIMIGGVVAGIISNGLGIWIVSRARWRRISLLSLSAALVLWTAFGISGFWPSTTTAWLAVALMLSVILVCGVGVWPASYAIAGETSALVLRSPTQGLGGVMSHLSSAVMAIVLPYIYNSDAGNLGAKTAFVYTALCAFALVATWFCVPELKGRSMIDIDHMFDLRLPTKKFERWVPETLLALPCTRT
ncbi:H(+)/hexose cotransporter 1 [Apiospora rasikravindrae]|uniref:H(+)/hexose cotransporter 1 n=1 Tax=Apiospora rasikravindrae TaxID=990691 RepID=A0ABR1U9X7_9PEZI